jgi:L-rhamnose mutarotase
MRIKKIDLENYTIHVDDNGHSDFYILTLDETEELESIVKNFMLQKKPIEMNRDPFSTARNPNSEWRQIARTMIEYAKKKYLLRS